ncbi:MAG TPA: aldose 1-epimerase family protein [Baekduia sp.]|nr:aldose 1-epimerase family protein [Baekduia sp.]
MTGGPHLAPSGAQHRIVHGDHQAVITEVGATVRRYRLGDWDVLDGFGVDEMCSGARGQSLIPWPNRLRDGRYTFAGAELQLPLSEPGAHNAIHGLVRWAPWTAADGDESWVRMEHVLHPQAGYPFTLQLTIEHRLDHDGLTVTTTARNAGSEPCPYGTGAHPYISVGTDTVDPAVLTAPGRRRLVTDDQSIPVGSEPVDGTEHDFRIPRPIGDTQLDTAYSDLERDADGWAHVRLEAPDGRRAVDVALDPRHRHLMLFTGDSLADADRRRRGLGVEPMTCPPNALQTGEDLEVLAPGESCTTRWRITPSTGRRGR